jgi:hypothetical protein
MTAPGTDRLMLHFGLCGGRVIGFKQDHVFTFVYSIIYENLNLHLRLFRQNIAHTNERICAKYLDLKLEKEKDSNVQMSPADDKNVGL